MKTKKVQINYMMTVMTEETGETKIALTALGQTVVMPKGKKVRSTGVAGSSVMEAMGTALGAVMIDMMQQGVLTPEDGDYAQAEEDAAAGAGSN